MAIGLSKDKLKKYLGKDKNNLQKQYRDMYNHSYVYVSPNRTSMLDEDYNAIQDQKITPNVLGLMKSAPEKLNYVFNLKERGALGSPLFSGMATIYKNIVKDSLLPSGTSFGLLTLNSKRNAYNYKLKDLELALSASNGQPSQNDTEQAMQAHLQNSEKQDTQSCYLGIISDMLFRGLEESKIDYVVDKLVLDYLVGMCAVQIFWNKSTKKIGLKYISPLDLILKSQYNDETDFIAYKYLGEKYKVNFYDYKQDCWLYGEVDCNTWKFTQEGVKSETPVILVATDNSAKDRYGQGIISNAIPILDELEAYYQLLVNAAPLAVKNPIFIANQPTAVGAEENQTAEVQSELEVVSAGSIHTGDYRLVQSVRVVEDLNALLQTISLKEANCWKIFTLDGMLSSQTNMQSNVTAAATLAESGTKYANIGSICTNLFYSVLKPLFMTSLKMFYDNGKFNFDENLKKFCKESFIKDGWKVDEFLFQSNSKVQISNNKEMLTNLEDFAASANQLMETTAGKLLDMPAVLTWVAELTGVGGMAMSQTAVRAGIQSAAKMQMEQQNQSQPTDGGQPQGTQ